MKNPKLKLIKWIQSMGYQQIEAIGTADDIVRKILPYCKEYNLDVQALLKSCLNDYGCTSLGKFKELINHRIKRVKDK
jgi:hypothetical protein